MTDRISEIIAEVVRAEGGYSNDPADAGGETMYGITEKVARAAGYMGPMRSLPLHVAEGIYRSRYVVAPGFADIIPLSEAIAAELVDTGVNMGPAVAGEFLQRALNALNDGGTRYHDLKVDGAVGPGTRAALRNFLEHRGKQGELVLLRALNAQQATRYIELAEKRPANERFVFGWLANRVEIA